MSKKSITGGRAASMQEEIQSLVFHMLSKDEGIRKIVSDWSVSFPKQDYGRIVDEIELAFEFPIIGSLVETLNNPNSRTLWGMIAHERIKLGWLITEKSHNTYSLERLANLDPYELSASFCMTVLSNIEKYMNTSLEDLPLFLGNRRPADDRDIVREAIVGVRLKWGI